MYRLLPFLFMLAIIPDSEKEMENIGSFVMATKESVSSIRNGLDSFHATMMPLVIQARGAKPFANSGKDGDNQA